MLLAAALLGWPARTARRLRPPGADVRPPPDLRTAATRPAAVVVGAVGAGAVTAVVSTAVVALLAGVCAGVAVRAGQRRQAARTAQRQAGALAEALGVLAAEVRAGRTPAEAVAVAGDACPDPATAAALRAALSGGGPPPGAAAGLVPLLARIAAAVQVSTRTGCSLAGVLTAMEDDLRARHRAELELASAVAGPRASAAVLAGLPVLGLLMGSGVGADPWRVLTTTGTGTLLLVAGVALELTGTVWSARLVRRAGAR